MITPHLYDLLDVAPDASEPEIRAAWKSAIAELDPTDRRFRAYNQAAEVLLDPQQRAAYDAELAAGAEAEQVHEVQQAPQAHKRDDVHPSSATGEPAAVSGTAPRRGVPTWLLAALAVVTAVAVGVSAWLWFAAPSDASVEESTRAAQSAAERAVGPILSYNAEHLDEDQQAAQGYLTSDYRKKYDSLFAVIKQNAPGTRTIVEADVVASGIVRSGQDRVDVLVFVNRPTTNKKQTEPVVYKDQVTVTMQRVDGEWLVDDMSTSPVGN